MIPRRRAESQNSLRTFENHMPRVPDVQGLVRRSGLPHSPIVGKLPVTQLPPETAGPTLVTQTLLTCEDLTRVEGLPLKPGTQTSQVPDHSTLAV